MQRECKSPESCIYAVGVVGEAGRIHQQGTLEITPIQLIYTPEGEQDSYIWPLRYIKRYSHESPTRFVIETSGLCPSGAGLYTFSTEHAAELQTIIARNTTNVVTSPKHTSTPADSQTTPPPSHTFAPPSPSMSSTPNYQRCNGVTSPHSPSPSLHSPHPHRGSRSSLSPTSSPTLSRSPSERSLPENAFEVKNIGEDESVCLDGILEVTSQELIYTDNASHHRRVWPLMFLRRYGCSGSVFSIEAGRRCPGGPGYYSFSTPRISELYELVQSYASNLSSSLMSLCSVDYSSFSAANSPSAGQVSYSQQSNTSAPATGHSSGGRSESPVFHRSDSFIRRAFSAMELRKNIFEVHNIDDNQQVLSKGTLEVTGTDLIYVDAATRDKWHWPIRYLRRYGCNGVRVFSFEAGRRCPGGEGLYAFATSRASEIHEAIIESINVNSGNQTQLRGNLSISRLSLSDAGSSASRNAWSRKASVPVLSSNHSHFSTPPPMRRPSQPPTLDEISSFTYPGMSTPATRQSVSSDETEIFEGSSQSSSGTLSPLLPSQPTETKQKSVSLPAEPKHPVQHTYDVPREVRDEYSRRASSDSKVGNHEKSSQKQKKKPMIPPPYKAGSGMKRFQRFSSGNQLQNEYSPTQKRINGHSNSMLLPFAPHTEDKEESFYQNLQVRPQPQASSHYSSETTAQPSSSLPDAVGISVVPQPTESSSLYANLPSFQGSRTPPVAQRVTQGDNQTKGSVYANLADIASELESGRGDSTPSSPSTLTSSYAEVEIIDLPNSVSVTTPDSTAWSPSSPSEKHRGGSSSMVNFTGNECDTNSSESSRVIYQHIDFFVTDELRSIREHRGDRQVFAELLERHKDRGSQKRKHN